MKLRVLALALDGTIAVAGPVATATLPTHCEKRAPRDRRARRPELRRHLHARYVL